MSESFPSRQQILDTMNGFRTACVMGAAAELNVWTVLGDQSLTIEEFTARLQSDWRATGMLLDAVVALGLLEKRDEQYSVPVDLRPWLAEGAEGSVLPMLQHASNILRGWSQLAWTVKAGIPAPRPTSIRGPEADRASFIAAMHSISGPMADGLVTQLGPLEFRHLLDVGGASGTWTQAFLRLYPGACATVMDRPGVIPMARMMMKRAGLADRVRLVPGDFMSDALPEGADLAWVSAIVHQNSRAQNRKLFAKLFSALEPGGMILIRDIVMKSRTRPEAGAMFAVNMLVNTSGGGTFTFNEIRDDLSAAGFSKARLMLRGQAMDSVVCATKPRGKSGRKAGGGN